MSSLIESDVAAKICLAVGVVITCTIASHLWSNFKYLRAMNKFPIVNERWDAAAKKEFTMSAASILAKGVALVS